MPPARCHRPGGQNPAGAGPGGPHSARWEGAPCPVPPRPLLLQWESPGASSPRDVTDSLGQLTQQEGWGHCLEHPSWGHTSFLLVPTAPRCWFPPSSASTPWLVMLESRGTPLASPESCVVLARACIHPSVLSIHPVHPFVLILLSTYLSTYPSIQSVHPSPC